MPKSRRKTQVATSVSKTGVELTTCYCRKCMEDKKHTEFYNALDLFLDSNGKMSVCKSCIQDIYTGQYLGQHSVDRSILNCCRILNIKFDDAALSALKTHLRTLESQGKTTNSPVGLYINKLYSVQKRAIGNKDYSEDFTFVEPDVIVKVEHMEEGEVQEDVDAYLKRFWGERLSYDDYQYLEQELANWQETTKCDTHPELILVKEICYKMNEIRIDRLAEKSVDGKVKALQELMKSSALTPSQQSAASGGKSAEAFGVWIKDIEQKTPAEWYKDHEIFQDVDNIQKYGEDFITRPLRNFITESRDFNIAELEKLTDGDFEEEDD